jgi:hypothetical protein
MKSKNSPILKKILFNNVLVALDNGVLYTWGCSSEGQNGLGEDTESPKRLYISGKVVSVACGYYHMAVVTGKGD